MKVHYFRNLLNYGNGSVEHDLSMEGVHGQNPKTCKACVALMVAVYGDKPVDDKVYIGVSFRNNMDHINRKVGRAIAIGRATKNFTLGKSVDSKKFLELVEKSYQFNTFDIKLDWYNFLKENGLVKVNGNV